MKKKLLGICLACCLLAGCTETGAATSSAAEPASIPASSSNVAESSSSAAESSSSVAESVSVPESSSSLVESASTPASSSNIAASVPAPQQAVPQSSAPQAAPSLSAQPVEREFVPYRYLEDDATLDAEELSDQTREYSTELERALLDTDYALLSWDYVAGIIGISTMTPEKVQAVVAEHPNEFVEVRYFPADCTLAEIEAEVKRLKNDPMIKKYDDKIVGIARDSSLEEYNVILISCYYEVVPELVDWAKTLNGPFEVQVIVSRKTNPG